MALGDLPAMSSGSYQSTTVGLNQLFAGGIGNQARALDNRASALGSHAELDVFIAQQKKHDFNSIAAEKAAAKLFNEGNQNMSARRLVQVFIADPNENIPLEQSLLYSGEQKLTDATDQELFFEIDIKTILAAHNEKRVKIVDKKIKERTEYLEPAKIRDLKMVVVNVASF